jgi:hypothetical protein
MAKAVGPDRILECRPDAVQVTEIDFTEQTGPQE